MRTKRINWIRIFLGFLKVIDTLASCFKKLQNERESIRLPWFFWLCESVLYDGIEIIIIE